ncbi:MAG: iron-containing alcohol dehydrogenase [Bryobacteraceae bacterium]
MVNFEFATAGRIVFGPGKIRELRVPGARPLLVTGRSAQVSLDAAARVLVTGEPTVDLARDGARQAREAGCDSVVAIGGGSVIDAGKAIAALVPNSGEPLDYLEVVGHGRTLERDPLPLLAIPTTAGAGAEATRNAVLASTEHKVKASMRHPAMLPRLALIDPELTVTLPPALTAATGLDALTQLIEPYVSLKANPLTSALCAEGMRLIADSLRRAWSDGKNLEARSAMSLASLYGGMALANAGLGAVHGLAAPIGGLFLAPHGAVCAALLGPVMRANIRALRRTDSGALDRYGAVAEFLMGRGDPDAAAAWCEKLVADLKIPRLSTYGMSAGDIRVVVARSMEASSMKANPVKLDASELAAVLEAAL